MVEFCSPVWSLMRLEASMPSMPGIFQSITTNSKGLSSSAPSSSVIPSASGGGHETSKKRFQHLLYMLLEVALSSTTKTFMPRSSDAACIAFLAFSSAQTEVGGKTESAAPACAHSPPRYRRPSSQPGAC